MAPEDKEEQPKPEEQPTPEQQEGGAETEQQQPVSPPPPAEPAADETNAAVPSAENHEAKFDILEDTADMSTKKQNLEFLYDIKLNVDIELGRAEVKVKDILSLKPGSVVELNRLAGDPVEIIVNSRLIARGEVIVIDDNFAVRVTDILTPSEIVSTIGQY